MERLLYDFFKNANADEGISFFLERTDLGANQITVGDRVPLRLRSNNDEKNSQFIFDLKSLESRGLDKDDWLFDVHSSDPSSLIAVPLKKGSLSLPSLPVFKKNGEELQEVGQTESLQLSVESSFKNIGEESLQPPPPYLGPMQLSFPWLKSALITVLVIVFLIVLYGFLKRKFFKKAEEKIQSEPEVIKSPDEIALEKIEKIIGEKLIEKKEFKKLYFSLSEIFKEYLTLRYKIDALEMTTQEISIQFKVILSSALYLDMSMIFNKMDLVKFANQEANAESAEAIIRAIQNFVHTTKLKTIVSVHKEVGQ